MVDNGFLTTTGKGEYITNVSTFRDFGYFSTVLDLDVIRSESVI